MLVGVGAADGGGGHGRMRRHAAKTDARACQKRAQTRKRTRGGKERVRGGRRVPYVELDGDGTGEMRAPSVGSPAAMELGFWAESSGGIAGYK